MNLSAVADLKPEIAWEKLRVADEARDLDDFREVCLHSPDLIRDSYSLATQGLQGIHQSCARDYIRSG